MVKINNNNLCDMNWWQISITLCAYGFFKEYRPSEPFISPYLTRFKNITVEEIYQEIYPLGTYFYLTLLVLIFLLTDILRYKPVLLAGGISAVITWCLLIFGQTILEIQIVEFFYGLFMASEVAYYTYIYAKVDEIHYQKVTSHTRAAFLLGKASAGLSSQLLVDLDLLDYLQLNYLTVIGVGLATLTVFFLPSVPQSTIYFRKDEVKDKENHLESAESRRAKKRNDKLISTSQMWSIAFSGFFEDVREAYTTRNVVQWSAWWAFATCGFLQVIAYCQLLWEDISQESEGVTLYHGYVEFATSVLGAASAFCIGYLKACWHVWGEISLGILTLSQGFLLFYCAYLSNLYIAYIFHISYQILYHAGITVATYEVAKFIKEKNYALVFGINTFFAVLLQTLLTVIVLDVLKTSIRNQFKVYGGYHCFMGAGFLIAGICSLTCFKRRN